MVIAVEKRGEYAMKYFLGIDGGGTKTEFLLAANNGEEIAHVIKGGCNPNDIGVENTCKVLQNGVEEIAKNISKKDLYIFAGVSGAGVAENAERIRTALAKVYPNVKVASDLRNALETCLGGKDGLAVICGTGISCSILQNGVRKTVGGYGYMFEDGGSGYAYGRDAVKAVLRVEDGVGEETVLTVYLREALGESVHDALGKILRGGKSAVASFCPLVFKGYALGDKVCVKIIERNLECTAALVNDALLVGGSIKKVAFMGGVSKERLFREYMKEKFGKELELSFCEEKPVVGALRLALQDK